MTTLLLKDLRLSLDVLRPWALTVVGLVMAALVAESLPATLLPSPIHHLTVGFLLQGLGACVALSAVLVGASLAAALLRGDDAHGARLMMESLPVAASRRLSSKAISVATASLAPAAATLVLLVLGSKLSAMAEGLRSTTAPILLVVFGTIVTAMGGAGAAWASACVVRGRLAMVAMAILLLAVAAILGGFGAWVGVPLLEGDLLRARLAPGGAIQFSATLSRCLQVGGVVGTIAAISCCLLAVPLAGLRRRSWRRFLTLSGATLATAFLAGLASTPLSVATDERLERWIAYQQIAFVERLSKEDLTVFVQELDERGEPPRAGTSRRWPLDRRLHPYIVERALQMRAALTAAELDADPLEQAFRSVEDFTSNYWRAADWLRRMAPSDPRFLPYALDAIDRFAGRSDYHIGASSLYTLAGKHVVAQSEIPPPLDVPFEDFEAACCDVLIRNFRRMIEEGHAEHARLEKAIDALGEAKSRVRREQAERERNAARLSGEASQR